MFFRFWVLYITFLSSIFYKWGQQFLPYGSIARMTWNSLWKAFYTMPQSVLFSGSVVSNSLRSHGLQHARPPCPSPTPRGYSNSCPLSRWCHPTLSFSVVPFSYCLPSFPASGSFKWVSSLHQVAKVLALQLQPQSFQWIFRVDFL